MRGETSSIESEIMRLEDCRGLDGKVLSYFISQDGYKRWEAEEHKKREGEEKRSRRVLTLQLFRYTYALIVFSARLRMDAQHCRASRSQSAH